MKKRFRIRRALLASLFVLTFLLLATLWLCQTFFFDRVYHDVQSAEITRAATRIAGQVENDDLQTQASSVAVAENACVRVYNMQSGKIVCDVHVSDRCRMQYATPSLIGEYELRARNGGGCAVWHTDTPFSDVPPNENGRKEEGHANELMCAYIAISADGGEFLILFDKIVEPFDMTVRIMRYQLVLISLFTLLIALAVSCIISAHISKPIEAINREAKKLSHGDYSASFPTDGFRECAMLGETLNQATKQLSDLDRMKEELIANISHDLRTPLTMIRGYGEVMRDLPGENTPENVQLIIDETERLSSLVNDLLDYSRLKTGETELERETFSLSEMLRETTERYRAMKAHDGYVFVSDFPGGIEVNADRAKLLQVLYNLINNAINYTGDDKTVVVSATVTDGTVRVSIEDHGEGIAKEDLPLIWDRYYKVDKTHKRPTVGTGLGLSIVKSILDLHGSRFGVSSELGRGSKFWFELPIEK